MSGAIAFAFALLSSQPILAEKMNYASPVEAYRQGMADYRAGHVKRAVSALEYAANSKVPGAQLWLARIFAQGDVITRDDAKAFAYYRKIANQFVEINPHHPVAPYASEAMVALAGYYRKGVPTAHIRQNYTEAARLYHYAASHFRDPIAQYNLARMYLSGHGVKKNSQRAGQWLFSAAKKNHAPSQALLGELFWKGEVVSKPRNPAQALALLRLATKNASPDDLPWVQELYENILAKAKEEDKEKASEIIRNWRKLYGKDEVMLITLPPNFPEDDFFEGKPLRERGGAIAKDGGEASPNGLALKRGSKKAQKPGVGGSGSLMGGSSTDLGDGFRSSVEGQGIESHNKSTPTNGSGSFAPGMGGSYQSLGQ